MPNSLARRSTRSLKIAFRPQPGGGPRRCRAIFHGAKSPDVGVAMGVGAPAGTEVERASAPSLPGVVDRPRPEGRRWAAAPGARPRRGPPEGDASAAAADEHGDGSSAPPATTGSASAASHDVGPRPPPSSFLRRWTSALWRSIAVTNGFATKVTRCPWPSGRGGGPIGRGGRSWAATPSSEPGGGGASAMASNCPGVCWATAPSGGTSDMDSVSDVEGCCKPPAIARPKRGESPPAGWASTRNGGISALAWTTVP